MNRTADNPTAARTRETASIRKTASIQEAASIQETVAAMARVVFQSGMGAKVVDAKWTDIEEAFEYFDPDAMTGLSSEDIDRLYTDPRVIRNRRKLEAIVDNARMLAAWEGEGGFPVHLRSLATDGDREAEVVDRLKFVGPSGAHLFLRLVGATENEGCTR